MKKITLFLGILLLSTGCAFVEARKSDWFACQADPICLEQAKNWQEKTEAVSTIVASAVPVPGAAAAPKVLGFGAFGLAMLLGGHALNKKKKAVTP